MKQQKRKGFTLVELLVVIAILAVLATVSIVGYISFVKKAKISNDTALAKQINDLLMADEASNGGKKPENFRQVVEALEASGFVVANLNPTNQGNWYAWDKDSNQMLYLDENLKVIYNSRPYTTSVADWCFAVSTSEDMATLSALLGAENSNTIYLLSKQSDNVGSTLSLLVDSGEALNACLEKGENVALSADIAGKENDDGETAVAVSSKSAINLNGHSLTSDWINIYEDVTISDGTIHLNDYWTMGAYGAATVTLENVTLDYADSEICLYGEASDDGQVPTYVLNNVTTDKDIYSDGANVIINGGTYTGNLRHINSITDGTYTGDLYAINEISGGTYNGKLTGITEINGGTINGDVKLENGSTTISGGTINTSITTGSNDLIITDGDFNNSVLIKDGNSTNIEISGGTFANTNIYGGNNTGIDVVINGGATFTNELTIPTVYVKATIKGGNFNVLNLSATGNTSCKATIEGGTFKELKLTGDSSKTTGNKVDNDVIISGGVFEKLTLEPLAAGSDGRIVIRGGTFKEFSANDIAKGMLTITGGTFEQQPESNLIADGYEAKLEDGKYVVRRITTAA